MKNAARRVSLVNSEIKATVTATGFGGQPFPGGFWLVRTISDGRELPARVVGKIRTSKMPCLEVGQLVSIFSIHNGIASIDIIDSMIDWCGPMKLRRKCKLQSSK